VAAIDRLPFRYLTMMLAFLYPDRHAIAVAFNNRLYELPFHFLSSGSNPVGQRSPVGGGPQWRVACLRQHGDRRHPRHHGRCASRAISFAAEPVAYAAVHTSNGSWLIIATAMLVSFSGESTRTHACYWPMSRCRCPM
jgi:hypothetical protein